ncbi:hypothetical protein [Actinomadura rayongensis]|uniref:hypothetical protein n=1 Tax=Actinomadura rayongensis TaxID=1429076 RepID=UPI0035E52546
MRWRYAAGGLDFDHPGFVHTLLVDMRARSAASARPDRIFERTVEVAAWAGLVGRRRVLDSAPIYDAVATQDTITLIRSAIRGLLRAADQVLRAELRATALQWRRLHQHGQAGHRLEGRRRAGGPDRLTGSGRPPGRPTRSPTTATARSTIPSTTPPRRRTRTRGRGCPGWCSARPARMSGRSW